MHAVVHATTSAGNRVGRRYHCYNNEAINEQELNDRFVFHWHWGRITQIKTTTNFPPPSYVSSELYMQSIHVT